MAHGGSPEREAPTVDVIVPAYNEQDHISACIDGVLAQDYAPGRMRLLLIDAGSSDDTVEIARRRAAGDERIVVVAGEGRLTTPEALNVGLRVSTADIFARVDAHGHPASDYISRAVAALEESDDRVVGVGGQPSYSGRSSFERAFTLARGSRLGVGGSVYAAPGQREITDTVPWGIYRRWALERVGGFDPAMNHGEDEELNWRLKQAGMSVMLDSSIHFEYLPRATLGAAFSQYRDYGRARARVVAAHPDFLRPRHAAPAALVLGTAGLAVLCPFSNTARIGLAGALAGYTVAVGVGAVAVTGKAELPLAPRVAACFPALHFGYGIGSISGFLAELKPRTFFSRYQSLSCRSR